MNRRMILRPLIFVYCMLNLFSESSAQSIPDTTFNRAISRIESAYWTSGRLHIKIGYNYEEHDSTGTTYDSMMIQVDAHQDSFYIVSDSIEQMQNGSYRIVVYNQDSIIQVQSPSPFYYNLINATLLTEEFRNQFITGYTKTDSFNFRTLAIQFKNTSPYLCYEITYDTTDHFISSIYCRIKKGDYLTPGSEMLLMNQSDGFVSIRQIFATSIDATFDSQIFESSRFFTVQNGSLVPVTPYANYELFNSIVQQ